MSIGNSADTISGAPQTGADMGLPGVPVNPQELTSLGHVDAMTTLFDVLGRPQQIAPHVDIAKLCVTTTYTGSPESNDPDT